MAYNIFLVSGGLVALGMKAVGNDRENTLTTFVFIFLCGNGYGNRRARSGKRNRNNSIGSMSITVGKRYLKAGTSMHVTTSNIELDAIDSTIHT